MDRDRGGRRFDDGEVVRYGAGESWRPTPRGGDDNRDRDRNRDRSPPPRRPRSPPPRDRDRDRSRPRSPRPRSPPAMASDSYVPGGRYVPPRRRSNSRGPPPGGLGPGDRYRRDRSRDSPPRRRERTRSPPPVVNARRSPLRRSPSRRGTPRRFSPAPRGDRFDRPRSPPPRRDWGDRDRDVDRRDKDEPRDRDWRDRDRSRDRDFDRRDDRRDDRRRSRSPINRDRRDRSPADRGTPPIRETPWRSSRSPSRRGGDRFRGGFRRSPPRDSNLASAVNSEPTSNRASPRPGSLRARSPAQSRDHSPAGMSRPDLTREQTRSNLSEAPRSPPRGPAALRAPPTGPAASRTFSNSSQPPTPGGRGDVTSPTLPPSGPRGYVPPSRGGYSSRGGRGAWNGPPRHAGPSPGPSGSNGPPSIPTGPRATSNAPPPSTSISSRPLNAPTGPSASSGPPRQTLAQSLLQTMPPIIPGGRLSPSWTPLTLGVTKELEPHYRKLKDEEEKIREDLYQKQEKLRKSLQMWDRLKRESESCQLKSELSEKSMNEISGDGVGGAAF